MIENTVDADDRHGDGARHHAERDELLWPGTLVTTRLTFREEEARSTVPVGRRAGQPDRHVRLRRQGRQAVVVSRSRLRARSARDTVLESGLDGGETVVTDGHLQLTNGARVDDPRAQDGDLT